MADFAAHDADQFERAAAQIGYHAVGTRQPGDHAITGRLCLAPAIKDSCGQAQRADSVEEFLAVFRLAHCGGRDHIERIEVHRADQPRVPGQPRQRDLDRVRIQPPAGDHAPAQPGHQLFVVEHHGRANGATKHHQADGIGPDIDNRLATRYAHPRVCRDSLGTSPASPSDAPRPESEGLVMK